MKIRDFQWLRFCGNAKFKIIVGYGLRLTAVSRNPFPIVFDCSFVKGQAVVFAPQISTAKYDPFDKS